MIIVLIFLCCFLSLNNDPIKIGLASLISILGIPYIMKKLNSLFGKIKDFLQIFRVCMVHIFLK